MGVFPDKDNKKATALVAAWPGMDELNVG